MVVKTVPKMGQRRHGIADGQRGGRHIPRNNMARVLRGDWTLTCVLEALKARCERRVAERLSKQSYATQQEPPVKRHPGQQVA